MKLAATIAIIALTGVLAGCGGGGSASSKGGDSSDAGTSSEVAEAVTAMKQYERLEAEHREGVARAGAMEGSQAAKGMEEAAEEFAEEAKVPFAKINSYSDAVIRKAMVIRKSEKGH